MRSISIAIALFALVATAQAKLPADFTGTVAKVSDGDTYIVRRSDGSEVKVRLHWADSPEVAHRKGEVSQAGGDEALKAASDHWLNKIVRVHPCGDSYGRIVADVSEVVSDSVERPVAYWMVANGYAMVDARYKPTKRLLEAQATAKKDGLGIWSEPNPIPPWEWRKMTRDEQIKRRKVK